MELAESRAAPSACFFYFPPHGAPHTQPRDVPVRVGIDLTQLPHGSKTPRAALGGRLGGPVASILLTISTSCASHMPRQPRVARAGGRVGA